MHVNPLMASFSHSHLEYVTPQRPPPMSDTVEEWVLHSKQAAADKGPDAAPCTPFNMWMCAHLYTLLAQHQKDLLALGSVYNCALSSQHAYEQLVIRNTDKTVATTVCQLHIDTQLAHLNDVSIRLDSLHGIAGRLAAVLRSYESLNEYNRKHLELILRKITSERYALNKAVRDLNGLTGNCKFSTANRLVSCYNCALDAYLAEYKNLMEAVASTMRSYRDLSVKMFRAHKQATKHINQDFKMLGMSTIVYPSTLESLRSVYCEQLAVCGIMQVVQQTLGFDSLFVTEILPDISLVAVPVQADVKHLGLVLNESNTVHYTARIIRTRIVGEGAAGTEALALMGCEDAFGPQFAEPDTESISSQRKSVSIMSTTTKLESDTSVHLTPQASLDVAELPIA